MQPLGPLPEAPEDATVLLEEALETLKTGSGPVSREAALAAFRRHLARLQHHVRDAFEQGNLSGLKAARLLASLTDGVITSLYAYALSVYDPDDAGAVGRLTV